MTTRTRAAAPRRRRTYHHGDLRRALVEAALALITEGDVGAVSLREVARRAGVTAAAPYHHFRDKEALLAALAEEGFRALNIRMEEAEAECTDASPRARLAALARSYVRFAIEHPAHYRVMFRPEWSDLEAYASLHVEGTRAYQRVLDWAATARGPHGKDDAETLALTTWAWVHGLASLWNEGPLRMKTGAESVELVLERSTRLFMQLVSAEGPSSRSGR
jgi:AcrR family transcriptional regulator